MSVIVEGENGEKFLALQCRYVKNGHPCTVRVHGFWGGFKIKMPDDCDIEEVHLNPIGTDSFSMDFYARGHKERPLVRTNPRGSELREFFSSCTGIEMPGEAK